MKLCTYRIDQSSLNLRRKLEFMGALQDHVLGKDQYWHFFLDPEGATLRFQPSFEARIRIWLKENAKNFPLKWKKSTLYEPKRHEYYGVSFMGDDILPLFHEMSVLATKYPPYILLKPVLERLNHGLINMSGNHNFHDEANIYMDLAFGRASLVKMAFSFPRWLYKLYIKLSRPKRKIRL